MATSDVDKTYTIKKNLLRGETVYQSINVKDDFEYTITLKALAPNNTVDDAFELKTDFNPAMFITPGLYITPTAFVSIPLLIFITIIVLMVVSAVTCMISRYIKNDRQ